MIDVSNENSLPWDKDKPLLQCFIQVFLSERAKTISVSPSPPTE